MSNRSDQSDDPDAGAPSLEWVLVEGAPHHVGEYAHLPVRQRPLAICPQCRRRVILKLGRVLRFHAAHTAGQTCPAMRAETALHINCKLSLASVLRAAAGTGASIRVEQRCAGAGGEACDEAIDWTWLTEWDAVDVEARVDVDLRPDIVLSRRVEEVGAIEVVVTNAVSAEKAAVLARLDLRWIEVDGTEDRAKPGGWTLDAPIGVRNSSDRGVWRCAIHAAEHATAMAVRASAFADDLDAPAESRILQAARVVDLYHAGGARERLIYRVDIAIVDGTPSAAILGRGKREVARFDLDRAAEIDPRSLPWDAIRNALRDDVRQLRRGDDTIVDSPMHWATGDGGENIINEALFDRLPSDPTPLATTFPRRWFYASERAQWFLPTDTRDVRWDRPALDAFLPHPAFRRARSAVRESAAPEGSWRTPIFARPPIAAMFTAGIQARAGDHGIAVIELSMKRPGRYRAIVVAERAPPDDAVRECGGDLMRRNIDAVWVSHPRDWTAAFAGVTWVPGGRDQYGKGAVLLDGAGVFRADAFAQALAKGDTRLSDGAIRRAMAARVERLAAAESPMSEQ